MRLDRLCALLLRILTWCTRQQVTLKARHILGQLNVVADKLSRLDQNIQTEWSLLPEVFQAICNRWQQPQIDLFATRFNNKLAQFVSPVLDPMAWAVGLPVQDNHSDCSRVAQLTLVLGPSDNIKSNLIVSDQPAHTTIQSDSTQESVKPKSTCLAPRIEAPQRRSTRSVCEAKWAKSKVVPQ